MYQIAVSINDPLISRWKLVLIELHDLKFFRASAIYFHWCFTNRNPEIYFLTKVYAVKEESLVGPNRFMPTCFERQFAKLKSRKTKIPPNVHHLI